MMVTFAVFMGKLIGFNDSIFKSQPSILW